tara:strand:+ start:1503 stop:1682 length:180 start_codon:yes stop_codon:yes gene_type:complete
MPISKHRKKNRSHKEWKRLRNTIKNSPRTKNDNWMKKTKRIAKGFCNYGILGQRFADYQ